MNEREPREFIDPDIAAGEAALNWVRQHGSATRVAARSLTQRRSRRRFRRVATGALALLTLATAGIIWRLRPLPLPSSLVHLPAAVAVVTPATQLLPDGSIVELKDDAKIDVNYTAASRQVALLQGEAHFTVAKDVSVPFVVIAGADLEVRAVGTAFSVQLGTSQVKVLVTEGRVAVDRSSDPEPNAAEQPVRNLSAARQTLATIDAGNRVVVERAGAVPVPVVQPVSAAEQNELLSWRVPRIELTGAPLSQVIPVFNQYGSVFLSLADESLGALEVSGVLRPNNPNALLYVLKVEYGLEAERGASGGITLRRP